MFCGLALSRTRLRVTLCLRLISTHPIAYKRSLAPHSSLYFTLQSLSHVVFTPVLQLISMRTSGLASESDLCQAQTSFFPQRFVFVTFAPVTFHLHHSALWAGLMTVTTFGQTMLCWQHLSLRSMAERLLVSNCFSSTQANQTHSNSLSQCPISSSCPKESPIPSTAPSSRTFATVAPNFPPQMFQPSCLTCCFRVYEQTQ